MTSPHRIHSHRPAAFNPGIFNRPDPKAGDYPWLSPYLYCAANPIRNIDPTGEDVWQVDENGNFKCTEVTDKYDRIEFVDKDGNVIEKDGEKQQLEFDYGTVKKHRREKYNVKSDAHGEMTGSVDILEIKGDDAGTKVFEMLAQNVTAKTENEIGLMRTGYEGIGPNFLTSGHQPKTETGTSPLFNGQLQYGYYIREHIHSHPESSKESLGDHIIKCDIQNFLFDKYGYVISFSIYHVPSKKYINY